MWSQMHSIDVNRYHTPFHMLTLQYPSAEYIMSIRQPSTLWVSVSRVYYEYPSAEYIISIHQPSILWVSVSRVHYEYPSAEYIMSIRQQSTLWVSVSRVYYEYPSAEYIMSIRQPSTLWSSNVGRVKAREGHAASPRLRTRNQIILLSYLF